MKKRIIILILAAPVACILCLVVAVVGAFAWDALRWGDDLSEVAAASQPGNYELTIQHDTRERTYRLHLPTGYDGQTPLPLLIALHGGGGNADNMHRMASFADLADDEGFILAEPNGTGRLPFFLLTWNAGNCCGYALDHEVDDVGFLRTLIETLTSDLAVDPARVYVTGISNGGMMSFAAACELDDLVAGIGPVVGAMNYAPCQPEQPVSLIMINGTADTHVPYEGGTGGNRPILPDRIDNSVANAVDFWTTHNDCGAGVITESGNLSIDTYDNCADGSAVTLITVNGGGHEWYGGRSGRPYGGSPDDEVSATNVIWEFFAALTGE